MKFPESRRVVYPSNPLSEVVCQIRFPRNLAVERELPVEFQRSIGKDYPLLEIQNSVTISLSGNDGEAATPAVSQAVSYDFLTVDRAWKISLSRDFIAVSTGSYTRWEHFRSHISFATEHLLKHYAPAAFTRLGLRYVNAIDPHKLGLEKPQWSELIRASLLGPLADKDLIQHDIKSLQSTLSLALEIGSVNIRYGLSPQPENGKQAFLIDSDFFIEATTTADQTDALRRLDSFHTEAGRLFRWCIADKLHTSLRPTDVAD